MYRIFLTNHGYFIAPEFVTFQEALNWAKGNSFEVSIWHEDDLVAGWNAISGTTLFNVKARTK